MDLMPGEEGWYAVAKAADLRSGNPLRRFLFGVPIVLFGKPDSPAALIDRCPHRSAPLSSGRIVDGLIECPFHGWRFGADGVCRRMPCLPGEPPLRAAKALEAMNRHGLIFVRQGRGPAEPRAPVMPAGDRYLHLWTGLEVKGSMAAIADNFLDATHTVTVHPWMLRSPQNTSAAKVEVTGKPGEVEVTYTGEGRPAGIIARLFEGERSSTIGRFTAPNVVDVEFHGPQGLRFAITSYLTPTRDGKVGGFAVIAVPGAAWSGWLRFLALKPFAWLVNRQDMRILNLTDDNHALFGRPPRAASPTDFVMADIEAILAGRTPGAAVHPRVVDALL